MARRSNEEVTTDERAHKANPVAPAKPAPPALSEPEPWRFSWHEDPDGVKRFHCPVCRNASQQGERRWPKTRLAQETLRLATELAQDAWLVDELGDDGQPRLKALVAHLGAIHRATLKGGQRQSVRFVLEWMTANGSRFHYADTLKGPEAEKRIAVLCDQFESAWTTSFGAVKDRDQLRGVIVKLATALRDRTGGRGGGYVHALRALWLTIRGSELNMDDPAVRQLRRECGRGDTA